MDLRPSIMNTAYNIVSILDNNNIFKVMRVAFLITSLVYNNIQLFVTDVLLNYWFNKNVPIPTVSQR